VHNVGLLDTAFFGALASVRTPKGHPGAVVLNPCDAVSAYKLTCLMADYAGLAYLRTLRPETATVYRVDEPFHLIGQKVLAKGKDLTLISWGYMVHECLKAIATLKGEGIACGLVDAYSLPLADDFAGAVGAGDGARLLVVEDNYAGGLGSAVAAAVGPLGKARVNCMTPERMPKSGKSADDVLRYVGLDRDSICRRVKAILGKA